MAVANAPLDVLVAICLPSSEMEHEMVPCKRSLCNQLATEVDRIMCG
jgi:hypothetical protein